MRPIGFGIAVVLMSMSFWPSAVLAASPKAPAVAISKDQRDKGKAAAPGLIQAAGLDCQLADARVVGENVDPEEQGEVDLL